MKAPQGKDDKISSKAIAHQLNGKAGETGGFVDMRTDTLIQRKRQAIINNSSLGFASLGAVPIQLSSAALTTTPVVSTKKTESEVMDKLLVELTTWIATLKGVADHHRTNSFNTGFNGQKNDNEAVSQATFDALKLKWKAVNFPSIVFPAGVGLRIAKSASVDKATNEVMWDFLVESYVTDKSLFNFHIRLP